MTVSLFGTSSAINEVGGLSRVFGAFGAFIVLIAHIVASVSDALHAQSMLDGLVTGPLATVRAIGTIIVIRTVIATGAIRTIRAVVVGAIVRTVGLATVMINGLRVVWSLRVVSGVVALRVAGIAAMVRTVAAAVTNDLFIIRILKDALATTSQTLSVRAACTDHAFDLWDQGVISSLGLQTAEEILGGITKEADIAELVSRFVRDASLVGVGDVVISLGGVVNLDEVVKDNLTFRLGVLRLEGLDGAVGEDSVAASQVARGGFSGFAVDWRAAGCLG